MKIMSADQIHPLFDRVLVKMYRGEERHGSIIKPFDEVEKEMYRGTVARVGPGVDGRACSVKPGDPVRYSRYVAGEIIEIGEEKFVFMKESDIFGVEAG